MSAYLSLICDYCGRRFQRLEAHIVSAPCVHSFCGRECSGLGRRKGKTADQLKAEKAAYDRIYRAKNIRHIKALKREHFKRTYDPERARIERRAKMPRHVEYCRQPEYRKWKKKYDLKYRSKRLFGPFSESYILLQKIQKEVDKRMSDYQIRMQQGTLNKLQTRRRKLYEKTRNN